METVTVNNCNPVNAIMLERLVHALINVKLAA
jgi:hypothetical protein